MDLKYPQWARGFASQRELITKKNGVPCFRPGTWAGELVYIRDEYKKIWEYVKIALDKDRRDSCGLVLHGHPGIGA